MKRNRITMTGAGPGHLEGVEQGIGSWASDCNEDRSALTAWTWLASKKTIGLSFLFSHDEPDDSID